MQANDSKRVPSTPSSWGPLKKTPRLDGIKYDLRGPVAKVAAQLEAAGETITKLNIGNPAPFGFDVAPEVVDYLQQKIGNAHGYSESSGLQETREAIKKHYDERGDFTTINIENIVTGNGVSELISITTKALLEIGDNILVPSPDYPLWTASAMMPGAEARHYRCDESNGWQPDVEHIRSLIDYRTRGIVLINPNNPTGAVYSRAVLEEIAQVARENHLLIFSDEIYDRVIYDDAVHIPIAQVAPDLPILTFGGLSKTHQLCGYRAGWVIATGFRPEDQDYLDGINLLSSMRLCSNVPAQWATIAALTWDHSLATMVKPGGRLYEQRNVTYDLLTAIDGVTMHKPQGSLYGFPRFDPEIFDIPSDEQFVLEFLKAEHVLMNHGTGFNWNDNNHLRIVFLPNVADLTHALTQLGSFADRYRRSCH